MVATDRLVQPPPDQFYRITLRTARWQRMQPQPLPVGGEVLLDSFASVARIVVYGQVQLAVTAVDPTQLLEQLQEQLAVFVRPAHPVKTALREVERPRDPHLLVGTRRG